MKPELITSLDQITPAWLTKVLGRSVADVSYESGETSFCITAHIRVTYTANSTARFFLKFSKPVNPVSIPEGGWEVVFYKFVAPRTPSLVATCYDAVFSPEEGRLHLLFGDLSDTHFAVPPSHLPPARAHCEMIVKALADVHAAWWEQPPWELIGWSLPDRAEVERRIQDVSGRVALFIDFLGDRLSGRRRAIYRDVLAALPMLYTRLMQPRAYTVIHDDIHVGNVLYPRDPTTETVRIVDWQTWHIDLAPKDLAHMMAIFWFPEQRRALEQSLLAQYHKRLLENGVINYSWDQLWYDYRLCVLRKLFHPPWQWASGHHPNIWWNHLERVMSAYDDLSCRDLLEM